MGERELGGGAIRRALSATCAATWVLMAGGSYASHSVSCDHLVSPPGAMYLYGDPPEATFNGINFGINGNDVRFQDGSPGIMPPIWGVAVPTTA